jgi:hypothetical protein
MPQRLLLGIGTVQETAAAKDNPRCGSSAAPQKVTARGHDNFLPSICCYASRV